ncbi:MAG TPA: ATP-dependent Clp protease ATP-binding subunit [Chitinophagales bacterium]|nr:ATP-dependent Clp protease ATP-binding subunit [Chitinophagales bacterium]
MEAAQEEFSLSDSAKTAIQIAQAIAKEYSNENFSPAHLLKALLHKDVGLTGFVQSMDKDVNYLADWAEVRIEGYPKAVKLPEAPAGDAKIESVFKEADSARIKLGLLEINPICILAALCKPSVGFTADQLKTFPILEKEIFDLYVSDASIQNAITTSASGSASSESSKPSNALFKFCIDKTALAKEGKLDPVIGRDREIRMMAEILGRRSKPNVILTGEPGVGKTACVNGFVMNIIETKVPDNLKGSVVFELDFGALIAGASYKGEVEERLKSIIREIKRFEKSILFIDNIHLLLDRNGGAAGASNILKPELAKGELTVIGATSNEDYRKHVETDETFNRLFEIVRIDEPDEITANKMIQIIIPHFETHHKIQLADGVIAESIRLAKRYVKERRLPDAAIDLIDRTMAVVKMMQETSKGDIDAMNEKFTAMKNDTSEKNPEVQVSELKWFYAELKNKISSILLSQIENESGVDKLESADAIQSYLENLLSLLKTAAELKKDKVEKVDVAAVVAHRTGIPLGKLQSQEKERLMNMESLLKKRVVGQDHALKAISEAILESRSGLSKAGQPIGSFFFLGPTGTGKTELAKSLAEFLFNDETALIRFDMSEFKEEHSAALLYGAPPGYVGYEEGGMLVNKIRQQPYAIVLFDEIEKAHPSVFDLFLQILDEGKLHDRLGKEGDFSNSVVLFTSNIGSDFIVESFGKGVIPKSTDLMDIMTRHFRPEFLGRLTEIVPFSPITETIVENIFQINLNTLLKTLDRQGITLEISPEAKKYLALSGFTPKYGARPLQGVIRMQIRRPISRKIISGELTKGDTIRLDLSKENELIWTK